MFNVICDDALSQMKKMQTGCFDLIITSPPRYNDNYDLYIKEQRAYLKEMLRLIPDTGAIFYNFQYKMIDNMLCDFNEIFDDFPLRQMIVWNNRQKDQSDCHTLSSTFEMFAVIAKSDFTIKMKACSKGDIWMILQTREERENDMFPSELPELIIKSVNAKKIFDPFMGYGSVGLASLKYNKEFTGIEINPEIFEQANQKLNNFNSPKYSDDEMPVTQLKLF